LIQKCKIWQIPVEKYATNGKIGWTCQVVESKNSVVTQLKEYQEQERQENVCC